MHSKGINTLLYRRKREKIKESSHTAQWSVFVTALHVTPDTPVQPNTISTYLRSVQSSCKKYIQIAIIRYNLLLVRIQLGELEQRRVNELDLGSTCVL